MALSREAQEWKDKLRGLSQKHRLANNIEKEIMRLEKQGELDKDGNVMFVQGGIKVPPPMKYVLRLERLREERMSLCEHISDTIFDIDERVRLLTDAQRSIIMERYYENKPLIEMIKDWNYSERQVINICNAAFEKICKIDNENIAVNFT